MPDQSTINGYGVEEVQSSIFVTNSKLESHSEEEWVEDGN